MDEMWDQSACPCSPIQWNPCRWPPLHCIRPSHNGLLPSWCTSSCWYSLPPRSRRAVLPSLVCLVKVSLRRLAGRSRIYSKSTSLAGRISHVYKLYIKNVILLIFIRGPKMSNTKVVYINFPYILTPFPTLYDYSSPRYDQKHLYGHSPIESVFDVRMLHMLTESGRKWAYVWRVDCGQSHRHTDNVNTIVSLRDCETKYRINTDTNTIQRKAHTYLNQTCEQFPR